MQLKFMSIMVADQEHALQFYTSVLGFRKMADLPMGTFRWLTVTSPDGIAGLELVLEPVNFEPARFYQKALFEAGIPILNQTVLLKGINNRVKTLLSLFRELAGLGVKPYYLFQCESAL